MSTPVLRVLRKRFGSGCFGCFGSTLEAVLRDPLKGRDAEALSERPAKHPTTDAKTRAPKQQTPRPTALAAYSNTTATTSPPQEKDNVMAYLGSIDTHAAYPRETNEFCALNITDTATGASITTGITVSTVADGTRPATFIAPTVSGGKNGITITGYTPGQYRVFAKVSISPFTPEIDCGTFTVS